MIQKRAKELSGREKLMLLTGLVVPRPIALVTTLSREDVLNCAPFSFYQGVCGNPPILSLSITRAREDFKDTIRNMLHQGEFVVHAPRREHLHEVEESSGAFPPGTSEAEHLGLSPVASSVVDVPGLGEMPVRMECRLQDQFPISGGRVTMFFGEVVCFHLEEGLLREDGETIDFKQFDPLARLGLDYTALGEFLPSKKTLSPDETDTAY